MRLITMGWMVDNAVAGTLAGAALALAVWLLGYRELAVGFGAAMLWRAGWRCWTHARHH
jgi:hypothetical protein